jgi:poly-gamma-glutamate synthesis protein (capsule biosynthesis protein)
MKLNFTGDLVYPEKDCININKIEGIFKNTNTLTNLEGKIISEKLETVDTLKYNLYSNESIQEVLEKTSVKYVNVANNHIQDFSNNISDTICLLKNKGINYFGTKDKPFILIDEKIKIYGVVANATGGNFRKNELVNRFKPQQLLKSIKEDRINNPFFKIVIYIHWGYELAHFPQPADREWAHLAIDGGANYIIGHHPHVVQGAEKYKNGYIFYSLGNFILPQVDYLGRKLQYFDERVQTQLIVSINFINNGKDELIFHILNYNKKKGFINLIKSIETIEDSFFEKLTPYAALAAKEYKTWFKSKIHSNKIFNTHPTFISYLFLNGIDKIVKDNYLFMIWRIRKFLIKIKIHKPYNW